VATAEQGGPPLCSARAPHGERAARLYPLVATCIAYGKNPIEYLTDVLLRISSCPQNQLDELLPHRWRAAPD